MTDTYPKVLVETFFYRVVQDRPNHVVLESNQGTDAMGVAIWDKPRDFDQWVNLAYTLCSLTPAFVEYQGRSPSLKFTKPFVLFCMDYSTRVRVIQLVPCEEGRRLEFCHSKNATGDDIWQPLESTTLIHMDIPAGIRQRSGTGLVQELVEVLCRKFIFEED